MKKYQSGFTLIELLVSISIIALLIGLLAPQTGRIMEKANSAKCANNLRAVGVAVGLYASDNDNRFPYIESMPSDEVYTGDNPESDPKPIYETLSPYGLSRDALKCPADIARNNYFAKEGSSYQWRNFVDGEVASAPKIYTRRGIRNPRASWLVITTDYDSVHRGQGGQYFTNRLYADGHVLMR